MAALISPYLDVLVGVLEKEGTREMMEFAGRFFYSEPDYITFNLIPSIVGVLLGVVIIIPLLASLPSLFRGSSSGYGYGADDGGYGPPESSYGAPAEYRSYQEYDDVNEAVRSAVHEQPAAQDRMDYARSLPAQAVEGIAAAAPLLQ